MEALPQAVVNELVDQTLMVFVKALGFKDKHALLSVYQLRKVVLIWTDKGVSAQYVSSHCSSSAPALVI